MAMSLGESSATRSLCPHFICPHETLQSLATLHALAAGRSPRTERTAYGNVFLTFHAHALVDMMPLFGFLKLDSLAIVAVIELVGERFVPLLPITIITRITAITAINIHQQSHHDLRNIGYIVR
jgi:hypothetical protein